MDEIDRIKEFIRTDGKIKQFRALDGQTYGTFYEELWRSISVKKINLDRINDYMQKGQNAEAAENAWKQFQHGFKVSTNPGKKY